MPSAIHTVSEVGAELLADLDTLQIVFDGLLPCCLVGVGERAELVGERLALLVLKGVGVHGIEAQLVLRGFLAKGVVVGHDVPRNVRAHGAGRTRQLVDDAAIFQLVVNVARLAGAGKTRKARAAGADAPGRHGHGIVHGAFGHRFDGICRAAQAGARGWRSPRHGPWRPWRFRCPRSPSKSRNSSPTS